MDRSNIPYLARPTSPSLLDAAADSNVNGLLDHVFISNEQYERWFEF